MTPRELAEQRQFLAAEFGLATEELSRILAQKPAIWTELRAACNSDKAADRTWESTDLGLREMQLRLLLKALEKKMSAARTSLEVAMGEARNLY